MNIEIGSLISFRYKKAGDTSWAIPRTVLVLNPDFQGKLHALYITKMSSVQQEVLQNVFLKMYSDGQNNIFLPMEQQIQKLRQELEVLNKQTNEMLANSQKQVVTPASGMVGMIQQVRQVGQNVRSTASTLFNKVKTFGRTPLQPQPPANQQQIQQLIAKNNEILQQKNDELNKILNLYQQQTAVLGQIPTVPKDPYLFYHQFLKPYIGDSKVMSQIYRKFDVRFILTPRIERLPRYAR